MAVTAGNLTMDINTPTAVRTIIFGDDDTTDVTTILAEGDVTIRNDGAGDTGSVTNFAGTIDFKKDSSLTASLGQSGVNTGTVSLSGAVTTDGTINVEQSRTSTITAQFANMLIKETGVVGGGALTLNPGTGNDIDVEEGGVITVTKSNTLPGSLTIGASGNPIDEFNMKGATSALNVDGSAKIYANSVRLVDVVIDVDGNGGNTDGTTASVFYVEATTGNIELAGTIVANADTDTALKQNNVTLVSTAGDIVNSSGSVIAIDQVNSLSLTAKGSIGTSSAPVTVNAKTVTLTSNAVAGTPNIYIENNPKVLNNDSGSNQVTLGAVTTGTRAGNISYKQTGQNLLVSGGVTSNGGSILIDPPVDVTVASDIDAGGGNITLQASNDISFTTGDLITSGTGTILVQADSDSDGAGNLTFTNAGGSATDAKVRTGSGTIQLRGEHISTNDFSAVTTGKIDILAGQGGSSTGEAFSASAANGSFDLSATTFDIEAKGAGIGQSGGNTIEIVASGQVDAEADGPIHLTSVAGNALSVGLIDAGANAVTLVGNANVTDTGTDSATDIIATTLTINDGVGTPGSAGTITLDTAVTTLNLHGGAVTIHDGDGLDIASITSTSLDLLTAGGITDSGSVSVTNLAKFNSTGNSIVLGDSTTANFGSLDFSGSIVTISESSSMEIAASEASGALSLVATGAITQTGVIDSISTSSFNSGANAITLTQANDFAGAVSLTNTGTANAVQITDANAIDLGTVSVGGALTVNSSGTITDSGAVSVAGLATLSSGGKSITLGDSTTLTMGSVDFAGSTVSITEGDAMSIAASEATGALSLTATGAITQTGRIDADNTTSLINTSGTNDNITLTNTSNDFTGAVSVTATDSTSDVSITDANALNLGTVSVGQNLTVGTTGAITNSGNITVSGLAVFNSNANAITLNGTVALNTFTVNGGAVSITETNGVILSGTSAASSFDLVTSTGTITDEAGASLSVTGLTSLNTVDDSLITLDGTNSLVTLTFDGGLVTIIEADGVELTGDSSASSLSLTLNGGSLTDSTTSNLVVSGNTILNTDSAVAISLDGSNDFQGTLSIAASGTGNVVINDDNSLKLADGTVAKNLTITAGGDLTQDTTSGFVVTGTTSLDVTAGTNSDITLNGATNDFVGAVTVSATDANSVVSIIDVNDLLISSLGDINVGAITATTGTLSITSSTGSINDATDDNVVDLTAGGLITLTAEDEIGDHATFTDKELELAAGSSVDATSSTVGAIRLDGLGALTLTDVDTGNGIITVTATGLLTATDVASLTDDDSNDITLTGVGIVAGLVNAGSVGDVTLSAGTGAIAQDGTDDKNDVIAHILVADATTGIDLDTTVNTANLSVSGSGAIIIDEMDAILLTDVDTANGAITVTAGGAITATDIASLTDNDSNDISITGNGIAATLINAGATGDITLNAGTGAISQDGTDDKDDVTADVLTADSTTGIDLDATISSANLSVTGTGSIMLDEQDAVVLTDIDTANGAISVTAGGAITATDLASTTDSDANDVSLTGNNIAVTLINAGTLGDVTLNAGTGAVTQDGTDDKDDVTADVLTADAATGINLDTTVASSDLSVSGTGTIIIDELDAIVLSDLDTTNGIITVTSAGAMTATDVQAGTNNNISLTTTVGDVTGVGTVSAGTGNVTILSAGSVIDDGLATTVISANNLDLTADITTDTSKVEIDTNVDSASITARATDVDETDSIILDDVTVTTLDLVAGVSVSDSDVAADTDTTSSVTVTGVTKINVGDDVILNDDENVFGEIDITAVNKAIIRENDAVSGIVVAKSLQVQGTKGITLKEGTAISSIAALSDSSASTLADSEIPAVLVSNTGGLAVDDYSTDADLALNGVSLVSDLTKKGKIDIRTKSPITVNAPISNSGQGQIILAALGNAATDDVTVNSSITGDDLEIYAGDSIILDAAASLVIVDSGNNYSESADSSNYDLTGISGGNTKLYYGTDFTTGTVQAGISTADVVIHDLTTLNTIVEVANSVRTDYIFDGVSNRLTYGTPDQIQDAYNLSDPNIESLDIWSSMNYGNVIMSNDHYEIEDEEEANITILKVRE